MTAQAVHADCVLLGTRALLLRGRAGSGKSSLADMLVETARSKGHLGLLVADDYVHLSQRDGRLLATVPETIRGKMEVRGFGLVAADCVPVARIGLVVDLVAADRLERLPDTPLKTLCLEGVQVALLNCPENDTAASLRLIRWAFRSQMPSGPDYI